MYLIYQPTDPCNTGEPAISAIATAVVEYVHTTYNGDGGLEWASMCVWLVPGTGE